MEPDYVGSWRYLDPDEMLDANGVNSRYRIAKEESISGPHFKLFISRRESGVFTAEMVDVFGRAKCEGTDRIIENKGKPNELRLMTFTKQYDEDAIQKRASPRIITYSGFVRKVQRRFKNSNRGFESEIVVGFLDCDEPEKMFEFPGNRIFSMVSLEDEILRPD